MRFQHFLAVMISTLAIATAVSAQQKRTVSGRVMDSEGNPVAGVTVMVQGTTNGVITDDNGNYSLTNVSDESSITFSCLGFIEQTKKVTGQTLNAIIYEDVQTLESGVVVAFGTQKKESVIGAVTAIKPSDLNVPASNLTTALAGRVAGVISYQRSGEPGADDASFFIRGITTFGYNKDPLILIDNIELTTTDLARLQPDDIESFSIMKDATATALYGARGANGVIYVRTKQGRQGKAKVNIRYESSMSQPTKEIELADPITYMNLHNEAYLTRNPLAPRMYPADKIANTDPSNPSVAYPYTDWRNTLLKDFAHNQRVNMNVSGGGNVARYYVAASYKRDTGILNVDNHSNFNNNINLQTYTLRSNINIDVTKTTELIIRMSGTFDDYSGPIDGGTTVYSNIMSANPVLFPAYYPSELSPHSEHTLFGNYDAGQYMNPYAEMVKGYKEYGRTNLGTQFELKQDLKFITKGLSARALVNATRISYYSMSRYYNPFYYALNDFNYLTTEYSVTCLNPDEGTDYLNYKEGDKTITANTYLEVALDYNREFGKHGVSGMLVYQQKNNHQPNAKTLQASLPYRNVGLSGRFTYAFNKRYFLEFNFGYNGSERFSKEHRFGFFPAGGAAWMISNEKFFDGLRDKITKLKLRASYGLVGNDSIGSARFLFLSEINMNDSKYGYQFGYNSGAESLNGISITRYSNPEISWEIAKKANLALEFSWKDRFNLTAEYYTENRTDILQARASTPASMGLSAQPSANIGAAKGSGVDIELDYNRSFSSGAWFQVRGNFTYAKSKFTIYEEKTYPNAPWKSHVGRSVNQKWGYIAESLFVDDNEVKNSPTQFGDYLAGDIKYRDINRDGIIDELDMVPIGYPTEPEINYGFGFSLGFHNFDLSVFFQGLARESFWINYNSVSPFFDTISGNVKGNNQLAKFIADSHWSEDNRDIYAVWPRLSDTSISNNNQVSTWFMRNGSFLRLKQLEFGYTLPQELTRKARIDSLRFYLSGSNLLCFSKFKLWDPEMAGNGLGYPVQRVYNLGLNINF